MEHYLVGNDDANGVYVVTCQMKTHLFSIDLLLWWVHQAIEARQVDDEGLDQGISNPQEELLDSVASPLKPNLIKVRARNELRLFVLEVEHAVVHDW